MPLYLYIGQHSGPMLSNINIIQGTDVNYISNFKFSSRDIIKVKDTDKINFNIFYLIQTSKLNQHVININIIEIFYNLFSH